MTFATPEMVFVRSGGLLTRVFLLTLIIILVAYLWVARYSPWKPGRKDNEKDVRMMEVCSSGSSMNWCHEQQDELRTFCSVLFIDTTSCKMRRRLSFRSKSCVCCRSVRTFIPSLDCNPITIGNAPSERWV